MIKFLSVILFGLIINFCAKADNNQRDILEGNKITVELYNRLKNLELISGDDKIIGLSYSIANEPTHKSEMYTFFTTDKLLQYYQSNDNEPKTIIIPISRILNIERKSDPLREDRIAIEIKHFRVITFNDRKQQEDIFDLNDQFWISYDIKENKQEKFYQLLYDTWTNNTAHEEMRVIYTRFYDERGNRRITPDQEFVRNKLSQLRHEIEKLTSNIINHDDFFVAYYDRKVSLFRFDSLKSEFKVFQVITKDTLKDNDDAMTVLAIYPIHKHGELALPYIKGEYTVKAAFIHHETDIEKIIEKFRN